MGIWVAPVSGMNWPDGVLMNTVPADRLASSLWPSTGGLGGGRGGGGERLIGSERRAGAVGGHEARVVERAGDQSGQGGGDGVVGESAPTGWGGVDWSYSVVSAPGPRWLRSSPYWKNA